MEPLETVKKLARERGVPLDNLINEILYDWASLMQATAVREIIFEDRDATFEDCLIDFMKST